MVSDWIARNIKLLRVLWVVLALICVAELIGLRQAVKMTFDRSTFVLLLASPFFLFGAVHLALMTGSWLQKGAAHGFIVTAKRGFFWMLLATYAIVLVAFIGRFGAQAW